MVQFAVHGKVREGTQDDFVAAVRDFMKTVSEEPGTVQYHLCQATDDPTSFIFFEAYDDRAAADAHTNSPQMQAFFEKVGPMLAAGPTMHPVVATAKG